MKKTDVKDDLIKSGSLSNLMRAYVYCPTQRAPCTVSESLALVLSVPLPFQPKGKPPESSAIHFGGKVERVGNCRISTAPPCNINNQTWWVVEFAFRF
jgi:hypothetical protein